MENITESIQYNIMSENKKPLTQIIDELRAKHIFTSQKVLVHIGDQITRIHQNLAVVDGVDTIYLRGKEMKIFTPISKFDDANNLK